MSRDIKEDFPHFLSVPSEEELQGPRVGRGGSGGTALGEHFQEHLNVVAEG